MGFHRKRPALGQRPSATTPCHEVSGRVFAAFARMEGSVGCGRRGEGDSGLVAIGPRGRLKQASSLELAIRKCKGHWLDRLTYAPNAIGTCNFSRKMQTQVPSFVPRVFAECYFRQNSQFGEKQHSEGDLGDSQHCVPRDIGHLSGILGILGNNWRRVGSAWMHGRVVFDKQTHPRKTRTGP